MLTHFDAHEDDAEERVGKFMVVLGAVLTGLTLLVLVVGWVMH
jgi:hypothetical protein